MTKIARTIKRICSMPAGETAHRLRERVRAGWDRIGVGPGTVRPQADADRSRGWTPDRLARAAAPRFYVNPLDREHIVAEFARVLPEGLEAAVREAGRSCSRGFEALGYGDVPLGDPISWHTDPTTRREWPLRFFRDYDPVHDTSCGDVKIIHELNRHHHVARLAKAFFLTGDERFAGEAVAQLRSWIRQNPPLAGINWQSSLEVALRCLSWMWALLLLLPSRLLDDGAAREISSSLFSQLRHVSRYPSLYSSPNTHLIGEAAALFAGGVVFDGAADARSWKTMGWNLLLRELEIQVLDEGVHAELSTYYHCYTVDFYLQALILARNNGLSVPRWAERKLARMLDFTMDIARPGGSLPQIGDDDGGRAFALARTSYDSVGDLLSTGAVLFRRPDFKHQSHGFAEETFWLLGPESAAAYGAMEAAPPRHLHGSYRRSGYFVQRSGWGEGDARLVFDCGGLGELGGGHGHADALSFSLAVGNTDVLTDPGTFIYNGAPQWREYFRGTAAHNTVLVDGRHQSDPGDTFRWESAAGTASRNLVTNSALYHVQGEHHGYGRLGSPIVHRRRVLFIPPKRWLLADVLAGEGEHRFDFLYHFAADVAVSLEQTGVRSARIAAVPPRGPGIQLHFVSSAPFQASVRKGSESPAPGWVSHRYGSRAPAPAVEFAMQAEAPVSAMTFLSVRSDAAGAEVFHQIETGRAGCLAVSAVMEAMHEDLFLTVADGADAAAGDLMFNGEFAWVRKEGGSVSQVFATDARSLTRSGNPVFEYEASVPFHFALVHGPLPPAGATRRGSEAVCVG